MVVNLVDVGDDVVGGSVVLFFVLFLGGLEVYFEEGRVWVIEFGNVFMGCYFVFGVLMFEVLFIVVEFDFGGFV